METDKTIPTENKREGKDIELDAQPDEVAELPPAKKAKTKLKVYEMRGSSTLWKCKCKKCGWGFIAAGADVTENMKRHLDWACPRKFDVPLSIPVSAGADIAQSQVEEVSGDKISMNINNDEYKEGAGASMEPSKSG
nr:hypothetical protein CFP56_40977 [Quercus suber]